MTEAGWYRATPQGWLLNVHVVPGAKRAGVAGLHDGALRIRIASPALEGRANEALLRFVSAQLDVPRNAVALLSGETSRRKRLLVSRLDIDPASLMTVQA